MKYTILTLSLLATPALAQTQTQEVPSLNELIARNNTEAGQLRLALGQLQEQTLAALKDADQTQDELQDELDK